MRFPSYLSRSRHGIYYLRVVTPKAVQLANPKIPREIRKSLNTRCPREAVVRSRHMALDWHFIISTISKTMSNDDKYDSKLLVDALPGGGVRYTFEPGDTAEKAREYIMMLKQLGQIPSNATVIDEMRHENPTPKEFHEAKLQVMDLKPGGPWLSEVIEAFAKEKLISNEWSENTWTRTYQPLLRDFREIASEAQRTFTDKQGVYQTIWDIPSRQLEEVHIRTYCDAMWVFPKNYGSIKSIGDAKQALNAGLPAQGKANGFKKIRMVKTFLKWAYSKEKLSRDLAKLLPVEKLDKKRDRSKDGYQPWTIDELKIIFERETYPTDEGWKYWTPILGLYTGGRANEIAQLQVSDIIIVGDIPCIAITDLEDEDDEEPLKFTTAAMPKKSVKTASSRRWIPIHPKLIELGFLSFVDDLKTKGEIRLFPELPYVKESGYGRKVSGHFAETTKRLSIWVERKKVFHSFRSTLNGRLMKLGMPQELREFVLGHSNESTNVSHYGKHLEDRPYQVLLAWLTKVDFGLSHKKWEPKVELPTL